MKVSSFAPESSLLFIHNYDIRCIYQPLPAMCQVIWFDVLQHSWISATLLGEIPYVLILWSSSPMHWTTFTTTTKCSLRQVSELTPYPCPDNIPSFTISNQSFCLALPMAYAHQSLSPNTHRPLKSPGIDPADTMLFNRCLS